MECEYFGGVDLSLNSAGVIILDFNYNIQIQKVITSKVEDEIDIRINDIVNSILSIFLPYKDKLSVNIEGLSFFVSKSQRGLQLAGLHYVLRNYLFTHSIPFEITPPTSLKKYITGKGTSNKNIIIKEIYKRWSVDFDSDDLADAYGLARMICSKYNEE
ncbi:MAG: hypothetical protein KatS3mg002_0446 [Candidatus Woesearchaeota archaeon]|nr:MAG: hypothetical protein KatS3mg002_0446 [Candidatus Woesearchaeota archaeon]